MNIRFFLSVVILVAAGTSRSFSQSITGTIQGLVTDSSGAVVGGAKVTAENVATGFTRTGLSNTIGAYTLPFLPTGAYQVEVEFKGFEKALRKGITLGADQKVDLSFTLTPGNITETVIVSESSPLVNSASTEVGESLQRKTVVDLPLNGRNFASLVYLTPGVQTGRVGEQAAGGGPSAWRSNVAFNANGMRATTNSYLLDGIDNNELGLDFTISVLPVVDAIQEFKVQTNNFSAEFGRALGGILSVTTRSGSNELHGGAYEFLRNSALDARDFFATTGGKPPLRQNQFGGTVGGPIRKNKLFFFGDYQGQRIRQAQEFLVTVPSQAVKTGDFTGLNTIYDPLSPRSNPTPFPGNKIPPNRINAPSRTLAALFPAPNMNGFANNFSNHPTLVRNDEQFDARIDHQIGTRDNYFVRYSFQNTYRLNPSALLTAGNPYGGPSGSGQFSGDGTIRAQNVSLNYNHVFDPTLVNEFRAGLNRFHIDNVPLGFGVNPDQFGIPGLSISTAASSLPVIRIAGFAALGTALVLPDISTSNNFQYLDTVSITHGRHNLRAGAGLVRRQRNAFVANQASGLFDFNGNFTSNNGAAGTGDSFASFLLGYPSSTARSYLLGTQGRRNSEWSGFVQDDIRLGRLTLNIGLRYEVYTPTTEVANRQSNLDIKRGVLLPAATNPYGPGLRRIFYGNIGPRVGLAWDITGNSATVLRASYGISYNEELYGLQTLQTLNIPFYIDQTITPGAYQPINRLSDGLTAPVLDPNNPSGLIRAINPEFRPGSGQMMSFNIQQQVTSTLVVEAGFSGTLGRHLAGFRDLNQSRPGTGPANQRRPLYFIAPHIGRVFYVDSGTNSHSEALLLKATQRLAGGLMFLASYTFGKTIEGQEGTVPGPFPYPMDSQNLKLERAVASFDRTHRFSGSWSYAVPFGRGRKFGSGAPVVTNAFIGGWQISGSRRSRPGVPFPSH